MSGRWNADMTRPRPAVVLRNLALIGGALFLIGLFVEPTRSWAGFLMGFNYLVGLCLAGPLFLALLRLAGARWAAPLRAVPAAMAAPLPCAFLLGLVLLFGVPSLYEWSHPAVVERDPLLLAKSPYLNVFGFSARLVAYFLLWWWLARRLQRSEAQAATHGGPALRRAALFLAVFAITESLASVDWLMSLEPHWFSTIYALRTTTGLVSSGLAAATLLVLWRRDRGGFAEEIGSEHLADLGRLTLSFSILWVYIWYCEFMLIWYSNIPEETVYLIARRGPGWSVLTMASLGLNWLVPFLVLLFRPARRSARVLRRVSLLILAGRAFDLYLLVGPSVYGEQPVAGVWELGAIGGMLALFFAVVLPVLSEQPAAADPAPGGTPVATLTSPS